MDFEDQRPKSASPVIIGEQLSDLSVDELTHRLGLLNSEISRVEIEILNKKSKNPMLMPFLIFSDSK